MKDLYVVSADEHDEHEHVHIHGHGGKFHLYGGELERVYGDEDVNRPAAGMTTEELVRANSPEHDR
jgi:hypothetical protein